MTRPNFVANEATLVALTRHQHNEITYVGADDEWRFDAASEAAESATVKCPNNLKVLGNPYFPGRWIKRELGGGSGMPNPAVEDQDMGGFRLTNVGAAEASDDAVNLALVAGCLKGSIVGSGVGNVQANATETVATGVQITQGYFGLLFLINPTGALDGVKVSASQDQTAGAANGIYCWYEGAAGALDFKVKQKGGQAVDFEWVIVAINAAIA